MASTEGPIANIKGSSQAAGDKNPQHVLVVDGSGNAVTFGGSGGTSSADGGTFTPDTTLGTPAMGAFETTPTTLTNNEVGIVGLTANRELKVSVTSGGTAGVQYTEGDTDATITGTAALWEDAANTLSTVSAAKPMPVQLGDGTDLATVRDVTGAKALDVSIVDGSGNQVTSFGGGVQYTEGDTDATITGTALLFEGAGNALVAAPGTAADGLLVNLGTNNDVTVTGTVTANLAAGANNIGDVDVLTVPAPLSTTGGGTEATALRVTIASDSTGVVSIDDNGASITVDGTVAVSGTVTVETELPAAAALADNTANPTAPAVGAFGLLWDGATWDRQPGTSADGALVNLGTNNDVTVTSGSITADTELPAAAALADNASNPTAPAVGAFGMLWDGATWDRAPGNSTDGQLVNLGTNNDVTVTGSVTANAGTNLNTSALALESGGNLAAATTALQLLDDAVLTDDAAFTPAVTKVHMVGFEADETSTDSVDEGDGGAARMTLDRKVITTPQPHTVGGLSTFRSLDLDESEEDVKTSPGQVYGVWFTNTATSTRWLKFYNDTAANVIVGTTAPVITLGLPGNSSDDISGVFSTTMGLAFSVAICVAATTGVADNDTGAPSANDVIVNVFYR